MHRTNFQITFGSVYDQLDKIEEFVITTDKVKFYYETIKGSLMNDITDIEKKMACNDHSHL